MRTKLLKYLKSYSEAKLLQYFEIAEEEFKNTADASLELYRLTNLELQKISAIAQSQKLKVFVVEANPIKFLAAFLAVVIAEVDLFLCDPAWQQNEWQQVLSLVKPDLILGKPTIQIDAINSFNANLQSMPDSPLIMIPTGGTSGKIRFTMHSWETLSASVKGFQKYFDCQNINSFCTLPLYHVSGLMQFMRSFITGGNLVLCPYKAIQTAELDLNTRDYFISLVPMQLQVLVESVPDWLYRFKTVLLGGAPVTRSLLNTARQYNISISPTYGMTETASGVVTLKPSDFLAGNNSSGRVLPHARVTIEPIDNKIGSIAISCASLCLGYYPQIFTSASFITDDLGYFDRDGYLHLVGRNSHKIITGGKNVFPAEVEAAIFATELVMDVCVIGIGDRKWGQAVTAIYVPVESDFDLEKVRQQVRSQLANYKQPKKWIKLDRLPRNNRGKINYQRLIAIAQKAINN